MGRCGDETAEKRRVASVLAADVAGYTRLMGLDELGTHTRLMRLRDQVVLPELDHHGGRLVKNTGDGFLAMFEGANSAVQCGLAIQRGVRANEATIPSDRRISFRMGVNVCEVIVEDHDIYGDGVNIAALLSDVAEPGGLAVSGTVAALVPSPAGALITDLGQQQLRHLPHRVRVVILRLQGSEAARAGEAIPGAAQRPSIAVLPFRQSSLDLGPYLAEGIVDNVIHALASLHELFVISRGSTMAFRDPYPDLGVVGRTLGVRYILHGSVQQAGPKLRVVTELTDIEAGEVVHTGRFTGSTEGIFELQDEIAGDVLRALAPQVRDRELRRAVRKRPQDMSAYELMLQALASLYDFNYTTFSRARGLLQQAMAIDPGYAPAFAYAARWHSLRIGQEWSPDVTADITEALRLSAIAIDRDPGDALAMSVHFFQKAYLAKAFDAGLRGLEEARTLGPNLALAWTYSAALLCFMGRGDEAVHCARQGVALSPLDAHVFFAEHILAQAYYICGDYQNAIEWGRRSDARNPKCTSNLRSLIATLAAVGDMTAARDAARRHQEIAPGFRILSWASRTPMIESVLRNRIRELRAVGLPD